MMNTHRGLSVVSGFTGVTECSGHLSRVWKLCRTYFGEVEAGQEQSGVSGNLGLRGVSGCSAVH